MKVRVNQTYRYQPNGFDRFHPCVGNNLQPGQVAKVINLPGAPKANTMGQCYVADPQTGKFLCMVSTSSLEAKSFRVHLGGKKYRKFSSLDEARTFCNNVASKTRVILAIEAVKS